MSDHYYHYESPNNPKCWKCGEPIKFNPNKRGKNERLIPLNPITEEPHRCLSSITFQEKTVKSTVDSNSSETNYENQNSYPKKVLLNLCQQDIMAELSSAISIGYNEIMAKLDNLIISVEEIKQNQNRIAGKSSSSLDDNTDKNQSTTAINSVGDTIG